MKSFLKNLQKTSKRSSKDVLDRSSLRTTTPRSSIDLSAHSLGDTPHYELNCSISMDELSKIKYMASGNFCDIFTGYYRGMKVAIKVPQDDLEEHEAYQLENELSILQRVSHPNCICLLGAGEKDGRKFLVLEYLTGGDLNQFFRDSKKKKGFFKKKPLKTTFERRLGLCIQLAQALKYIHDDCAPDFFLIHRDLKPHNVGLTEDGNIKLMDFGLSKFSERSGTESDSFEMTGETGTPRYMAPEVALSNPYNTRIDTYSFGIICWQMLTLQLPFDGMKIDDFTPLVVEGGMRPECPSDWPNDLTELVKSCWHQDLLKRPNFNFIVSSLQQILSNEAAIRDLK
mmetsp:Transcript_31762/g.41985  ORF Transcript_31762/g.41985 Transcript_31762/m.41985 type:complete len:342 (+) Transcript_31762:172-1197(+)